MGRVSVRVEVCMVLFFLFACATTQAPETVSGDNQVVTPAPAEVAAPEQLEVLATRDFGGVRAVFLGETLPEGLDSRFGIREIRFEINGKVQAFKPAGTVQDSDWSFEIATAEGDWIVLPQDHYGPYHVISTARLGEYLGGGKADHELHQQAQVENAGAWVHADARWEGRALVYRAGLTDMMEFRFELPN